MSRRRIEVEQLDTDGFTAYKAHSQTMHPRENDALSVVRSDLSMC